MTTGTKVGPYEIVAPIGAGGMGEMWRARDTYVGSDVAVKRGMPAYYFKGSISSVVTPLWLRV